MANKKTYNLISIIILIFVASFTLGCGGGGGGGGTSVVGPTVDINPNSVVAPGTSQLATEGSVYSYAAAPAANIALKIPVDQQAARFALVVTNPNSAAQNVQVKPESYVLGTVRSSVRSESSTSISAYSQLILNQAPLESRLRAQARQRIATGDIRANRSIRASDHSGEVLNQIVNLKVVADWWGNNYVTRPCKLVRIGQNCKIFVDQDPYDGLSAVTGNNAVTTSDLDHFQQEYETYIHGLITGSYANFYDIDNDGKVSILISPVYAKLGFAGLFNSNDFADNANSNQRDLIGLFSPDSSRGWSGERWREATRETICHEMQHLVNYSAHFYFNNVNQMEEEWLDESLSVGAEARYRLLRGSPILENRFSLWADSPSTVGLLNFSRTLPQYGMVGLFNFFMYEQSDSATIKAMVNSTKLGKANLDELFAAKQGMNGIFRNWAMAVLIDALRAKNLVDASKIRDDYKYKTTLNLPLEYTSIPYGYSSEVFRLPAYAAAFFVVEQPAGFNSSEYQFRIESESGKNVDILMVRLPN